VRIGCFHLNQIGDLLFSLPALHNLRQWQPDARLISIVRPSCRDLLSLSGLVDDAIERTGDSLSANLDVARKLRREQLDLLLLFSTSAAAWYTAMLSGARERIGFTHCLGGAFFSHRVPWSPPPSTENDLRLVEAAGCPVTKRDYVGLIRPGEIEVGEADRLLESVGVAAGEETAVLSPGSSPGREIKRWPDECCARVADRLHEQFGLIPVIVGMKGDAEGIMRMSRRARDITGRTSLPVLAGVIARSRMVVGTDSGVMHLAGAVGAPVIALFGPTDHTITGPQGIHRIVCLDLPCAPCQANTCAIGRPCMEDITPDMVIRAVSDLGEDHNAD